MPLSPTRPIPNPELNLSSDLAGSHASRSIILEDRHSTMENNLITLHTFNYRHEAEMAKSALEANGVLELIFSDDGGRQEVSLQFVRGAKLMVHDHDAMRAKRILKLP